MLVDTFTRISLNNECILQSCRDMHLSICTCICISIRFRLSEPSHTLQTLQKVVLMGRLYPSFITTINKLSCLIVLFVFLI